MKQSALPVTDGRNKPICRTFGLLRRSALYRFINEFSELHGNAENSCFYLPCAFMAHSSTGCICTPSAAHSRV